MIENNLLRPNFKTRRRYNDEFSNLPVSGERKYQLRMRKHDPKRYYAEQKRDNIRDAQYKKEWMRKWQKENKDYVRTYQQWKRWGYFDEPD